MSCVIIKPNALVYKSLTVDFLNKKLLKTVLSRYICITRNPEENLEEGTFGLEDHMNSSLINSK